MIVRKYGIVIKGDVFPFVSVEKSGIYDADKILFRIITSDGILWSILVCIDAR